MQISKSFQYPYIDMKEKIELENQLESFLSSVNKDKLFGALSYIMKELVGNATKANFKRIHFKRMSLKIDSPADYAQGMENFMDLINDESEKYFRLSDQLGFYVKIDYAIENESFILSVLNNSTMLPFEKEKLKKRFDEAGHINDMEDVMSKVYDSSEGAGLGFVMMLLMLRKLGVKGRVFKLYTGKDITKIKVAVPLLEIEEKVVLADSVVQEINEIPQFQPHILKLVNLLDSENTTFAHLSEIINRDPALIADLLKLANSAHFGMAHKIENIHDAVKIVGFQGIRNLVLAYSAKQVLSDKYRLDNVKKIMDHSTEVAFYAQKLMKHFKVKDSHDNIYTGSILHDIGKILIYTLNPTLLVKIKEICSKKQINPFIVENLTNGFNHSYIGARMAEKWNFSPLLVNIIKYHHVPMQAEKHYFEAVCMVYIANILYYYKRGENAFTDFSPQVLKHFNVYDEKKFTDVLTPIMNSYKE